MAKSPKAPDPYQSAQAQMAAEMGAAGVSSIMNNPNTYTPYGSQTYKIAGYENVMGPNGQMMQVPRYNQTQTLSPSQQKLYGYETATQGNIGQAAVQQSAKLKKYLNQSIDPSGWQAWNAGPQAADYQLRQDQGPTDRQAIEDAMMASYSRQADPRNAAQQAQLTARGAGAGTPIYGQQAQQQGDQFGEATRQAYLASGGESRAAQEAYNQVALNRFNMGGQEADRENALRGLQANQAFALRNQPINEIMSLLGGTGVTMPQFANYQGQGVNAPNLMGAIQQQYQQKAQNANAFNSGLFGLGATALGTIAGGPIGGALAGGLARGATG